MSPQVWQIACGDRGRRYDELFLEYDVMFLGPSGYGPYSIEAYDRNPNAKRESRVKLTYVRQFATEVKRKEIVLLRAGYEVIAIGFVVDEYEHNPAFDDVYGWQLEHTRRVVWQHQHGPTLRRLQAKQHLFKARKQIPTFTRVHDRQILNPLEALFGEMKMRPLKPLPPAPSPAMTPEQFSDALFREGLGYDACLQVQQAIRKLSGLLSWYDTLRRTGRPTEHEVVAHLILPLMLALGWSEQLLAVEWKRIDLAVFSHTPTDAATCALVCEAKGMGRPLRETVAQAIRYCKGGKLDACRKILVADGGRFSLYRKHGSVWDNEPSGYINLRNLRRSYLIPTNADAVKTVMALTPAHIAR